MAFDVNNVGRMVITLYDTRYGNYYRNVLHWRGHEGTGLDAELDALVDNFGDAPLWAAFAAALEDTTELRQVSFGKIQPTPEFVHVKVFEPAEYVGEAQTTALAKCVPQAAACIIRKSYIPGRKGIGRTFVGPLGSYYFDNGRVLKDPTGAGDLTDIIDKLGDPYLYATGSKTMVPIICNRLGTDVSALNVVRKCNLSPNVSFLRSRKLGVGE